VAAKKSDLTFRRLFRISSQPEGSGAMPIYILTILCAAALVVWVYHYDRYEKEPWWAILVALVVGFGVMWIIGLVDDIALRAFQFSSANPIAKAALIAAIEEGGKFVTILFLAILLWREFNDPMDGLIYGRLMGLGMAVEESLLYLSLSPPTLQTLGTEIVRLFAHSLMGGLIGFAIGLGGSPRGQRRQYPVLALGCLMLSTFFHFGWNCIAYSSKVTALSRLGPMVIMASMLILWAVLCRVTESRSRILHSDT
jgi:RsiW-degrading membrane proteinase PrsW (M82 family)